MARGGDSQSFHGDVAPSRRGLIKPVAAVQRTAGAVIDWSREFFCRQFVSRDAIFGDINRKVLQFFELHSVALRGGASFVSFLALVAAF